MNTTFNVRFYEIQHKRSRPRRPYGVRWITEKKEHGEWFANKTLAKSRLSELMGFARAGEAFDVETGLPVKEVKRRNSPSVLTMAQSYMDMKWPELAATSRAGVVKGLTTATVALLLDGPGRPEAKDVRRVLLRHLLPPTQRNTPLSIDDQEVADWIIRNSRPLHDLTDATVARSMLDALASKLDGKPVSEKTYRRNRSAVFNMLDYADERDVLPDNPLIRIKRKTFRGIEEVDPRVVANPRQARELLTALTYVGSRIPERGQHLQAFFAILYYSGARPEEGLALTEGDCKLPEQGWGELILGNTRPSAGKLWTDSGEVHDQRGLKHRRPKDTRPVPIPPVLVRYLRDHLDRYSTAPDGRLFRSPSNGIVGSKTYTNVWHAARSLALTPAQRASQLAGVPYNLRHACVSLWLNSGVPAPEVAARAGHSVDVLMKVYAKCIDGQRDTLNSRIDAALNEHEE